MLKIINYDGKIRLHTLAELQNSYQRGKEKLADAESNFKKIEALRNELVLEKNGLENRLGVERQNLNILKQELEQIRKAVHQLIQNENRLNDLQEVKSLLDNRLNIKEEKEKVAAFQKDWEKASNKIEELNNKIGDQNVDEQAFIKLQNDIAALEQQVQNSNNDLAVLREQIKENIEKIALKKTYSSELNEVSIRTDNLRTLANMFKAKGFVRFVSSIYLKNLVGIANQRFMQLTKNNLSLELNEEDDFIVRDYLNNGRARLLKTLSGGQTFQAALCLALALAEHVKSLNTSEKSFFFLDEGFGTLDKQSLQVVFETLRTLKKENRIVGIISHVEELQQEIEVALHVKNNQENGSYIQYSWS